jgi:hypothetical protein
MSDGTDDEKTYFCVFQDKESVFPRYFNIDSNLEELTSWAESRGETSAGSGEPSNAIKSTQETSPLSRLIKKSVDISNQQFELVNLLSVMTTFYPNTLAKAEIVDDILTGAYKVKSQENYSIYLIDDHKTARITKALERINKTASGLRQFPHALLLSMVATFDSQMSDVVRAMLSIKSDKLRSGQKQISLSSIMEASSLQEIIDDAVTDEVYQFSRNSHDEQVKYIEDNFDIEIRKSWKRWPDIIEIFETRNLVAHGEDKYTSRYVSICVRHKHKGSEKLLGKDISIYPKYLRQSLDTLLEFSVLLVFSLWRKHVAVDENLAFATLNEVVFELILNRRANVAVFISEFALSLRNTSIKEATRLRIVVNLASAHMHSKNEEGANKILDGVDWSATSDDFKVCVAALRKDTSEIRRLLPMIKASGSIAADDFRDWPVFEFVREEPEFQECFLDVFGQHLQRRPKRSR